jgi:hypothetical protein
MPDPSTMESTPEAWEALVQEMSGADGASLDAINLEVDGASPWPGDDVGGSLWDLVMHGAIIGVLGSIALGDATLAPGSSSVVGPGISGLLLLGSPAFHPRLSIGGGRRTTQSSRVRMSLSWRGCCIRR